ncbi:MAG: transposase [Dehalococcoidia bacterium]
MSPFPCDLALRGSPTANTCVTERPRSSSPSNLLPAGAASRSPSDAQARTSLTSSNGWRIRATRCGRIILVCDNASSFTTAALYEAFDPVEAHRIARRIEWHYTPKHGSWLNVAEMELSVLARQCLDRRIPDLDTLTSESSAWVRDRNATSVKVDWQFTADDARIKLKSLYPVLVPQ